MFTAINITLSAVTPHNMAVRYSMWQRTVHRFRSTVTAYCIQRFHTTKNWHSDQICSSSQAQKPFSVPRFYNTAKRTLLKSRDSSVGIALGYGLDYRGSRVRFLAGAGNFSLHHRVQNGSGSHPAPIQWVLGALSLGVKQPGREADHSHPSSAEVKEWVELYIHSPNTPSWRGAYLSTGTTLPLTFTLYRHYS
jgi:hypothetical protein